MSVTAKLLQVFLVEKQIRGLQSRLKGAESFLGDQVKQMGALETKRQQLQAQLKQAQVRAADSEGETKRLDAKIEAIREQMNNAQTNKEYKAFLTEINTFKAEKDRLETDALQVMGSLDDLKKQLGDLDKQVGERESVKKVAEGDRAKRHGEVGDRLTELRAERDKLATDVPPDALAILTRLVQQRGEDAMAPVEVHDFKRGEFHCGACMIALPVDHVAGLMSSGRMTRCVSCQCVLYMDEAAMQAVTPSKKGEKGGKGGKAKASPV